MTKISDHMNTVHATRHSLIKPFPPRALIYDVADHVCDLYEKKVSSLLACVLAVTGGVLSPHIKIK